MKYCRYISLCWRSTGHTHTFLREHIRAHNMQSIMQSASLPLPLLPTRTKQQYSPTPTCDWLTSFHNIFLVLVIFFLAISLHPFYLVVAGKMNKMEMFVETSLQTLPSPLHMRVLTAADNWGSVNRIITFYFYVQLKHSGKLYKYKSILLINYKILPKILW